MKFIDPVFFTMHHPRKIRRRRRHRSCPPKLKPCANPGAQPRGHTMASHPSTGQPNAVHSREGTNTQAHHNTPVERYDDGTGQYPRANNGLPCFRSHSRAHRRILGIGPYWNPPRTTTISNNTAKTTWSKGPKMTDCEWMPTDDATAATTSTVAREEPDRKHSKTTNPTAVREEPEWRFTPPATNKRRRPCPREAWSGYSDDSMSHLSQHIRRAETPAADDNPRDDEHPENVTTMVRYCRSYEYRRPDEHQEITTTMVQYCRSSDGSLPSSHTSQRGDSEHELATWDPFWVHDNGVDHE
ncbi:hypothetical protein F4782DRAFT_488565 [Xylaria castorea]|nr:hypothetical protein F4782DRAFT_488565 [Xylaria castorea]